MESSQPPLHIVLFQLASNVRQRHCIPRLSPRGAKKWHSFSHVLSETLHISAHDHPRAAFDASLPCCWSIEQVWNVRRKKISTYQSQTPLVLTSRSTCFVEKMKNREMVDSYLLLLPSPPYWYPHQHMPIEACQHNKWRRRSRNDHFTHPKLSWSAKRVISTCGPCSSPLLDRTR